MRNFEHEKLANPLIRLNYRSSLGSASDFNDLLAIEPPSFSGRPSIAGVSKRSHAGPYKRATGHDPRSSRTALPPGQLNARGWPRLLRWFLIVLGTLADHPEPAINEPQPSGAVYFATSKVGLFLSLFRFRSIVLVPVHAG
jgi:hypothetical protein